jgi:hypothetical protein
MAPDKSSYIDQTIDHDGRNLDTVTAEQGKKRPDWWLEKGTFPIVQRCSPQIAPAKEWWKVEQYARYGLICTTAVSDAENEDLVRAYNHFVDMNDYKYYLQTISKSTNPTW